jgi:hypothetical protein
LWRSSGTEVLGDGNEGGKVGFVPRIDNHLASEEEADPTLGDYGMLDVSVSRSVS